MQSFYPEQFEREMACTEAEWLMRLPSAVGGHACELAPSAARVQLGEGELQLRWQVLPARAIALIRLPRLQVAFVFRGVAEEARQSFMRRFDLHMQRGGG